jgi:hypothetical protein
MIGRRGLADPEVWEEVEPGSGEDGGRTGRWCGDGGSMMAARGEYQVGWCWVVLGCRVVECCSNVVEMW